MSDFYGHKFTKWWGSKDRETIKDIAFSAYNAGWSAGYDANESDFAKIRSVIRQELRGQQVPKKEFVENE